jgi:hypothetical protein
MPATAFCTASSRPAQKDEDMDAVAIALGIVMFMILLSLIEGIDRV